mmetsp:Transcript_34025/g.87384  ORF Transcript_34025/g.87384 Transcript_34025/m.87384 type:complete len:566 (-) Transcript_34025:259-1956(-)
MGDSKKAKKKVTAKDIADFFRGCTNPTKLGHRLILLLLICLLSLGSYYSYDIPGAIGDTTMENFFNTTSTGYALVYSIYSIPNMVLAFIGGILLDKVGLRFGSLLFCALVLGGQVIVSVGAFVSNIYVIYVGRAIFGLGGESLTVSQNTYTAKWFKGNELAFAFGVVLSFSRIGSAINFDVTPLIEDQFGNTTFAGVPHVGIPFSFAIGGLICAVSFVATVILALLDKRGDKIIGDKAEATESGGDKVNFKDILKFPVTYWIINAICVTFYVTVFVFIQFGNGVLMEKWLFPKTTANPMVSIPYTLAAASSFIFGFIIDRIGRSAFFVTVSCSILTTSMGLLAFSPGCPEWQTIAGMPANYTPTVVCPESELAVPWAAMFVLGIAYTSLAAALWPSVALIIDDELLGSAYGLMTAIQNIGLFVGPIVAGVIVGDPEKLRKDDFHPEKLQNLLYFFFGLAACSTLLALLLMAVDRCKGQRLNASAKVMKQRRKEKEAQMQSRMESERVSLLRPKQVHNMRNAYLAKLGIAPTVEPLSPAAATSSFKSPEWPVAEVGEVADPIFTPR